MAGGEPLRRGDLVSVALQGDLGKPRPALVIQSELFAAHPSVALLPITSELIDAPLIRIPIPPSERSRLTRPFQVMVDRPQSVSRMKLGPCFGRLEDSTLLTIDRALAVFLGLV